MANLVTASEIKPRENVSVLIYGQPSVGKTTLACSASNAVLFDYDGGVHRINPSHVIPTLQVENWEDTANALDEIASNPLFIGTRTIVIDTVGKMLDFMSDSIIRNNPKMRKYDGTLSLQGYGQRKKMFTDFIHTLAVKHLNVVFVAHEKEDKDGESTIKRPLVGGSSASDLLQELDLVGYMQYRGLERTISFNASESFYAKDSCYLGTRTVPACVDANGNPTKANDFVENVIFKTFRDAQAKKVAMTKKFNDLLAEIDDIVANIDSVEALNEAAKAISKKEFVFDAKIRAAMAINAKAKSMGAKYDKEAKCYVVA